MDILKKLVLINSAIVILSLCITTLVAAYNPYDYNNFSQFFLGFSIFIFALIIIFIILWIFVLIWVYKDAKKRGMNEAIWVIIVFLLSIIGLVIYLIARIGQHKTIQQPGRNCPNCGRLIPMDAQICPYCGKDFRPPAT